jgi:DNA-binding FrmR family transcriptional regulator
MVNEDRYCVDIITQISAIKSAVDSIAMQILENHMHGCVNRAIAEGECEETIDELMKVMKMLSGKALK